MKSNTFLKISIALAILALVVTLFLNITFGFFHLILVFIILMFWQMSRPPRWAAENVKDNVPMNPMYAYVGAAMMLIMLSCCYWTLNNYINPNTKIFKNSDHHIVSIDSITIAHPENYVLAGHSTNAFIDDLDVFESSSVTIAEVGESSLTLNLRGITTPVYCYVMSGMNRNTCQILLNKNGIPIIDRTNPTFTLTNNQNQRLTITIEEVHENGNLLSYASDSTIYWYQLDGGEKQKAKESTFLHTGLPLDRIIPDVDGFDLEGISLLRPMVYPTSKRDTIYQALKGEYAISISPVAIRTGSITNIEHNGTQYPLSSLRSLETQIELKYGQSIVFGYGDNRTQPIAFQKAQGASSIKMVFINPIFKYLSTMEDSQGAENTLYFTTSLSSGNHIVDPQLPENVLLFDLFRNPGNIHNMHPGYLSFVNGKSTERMTFNVHITSQATSSPILLHAGEKFPDIYSSVPGESWALSVKNLKETSPFAIEKIYLFLLIITLIAISLLIYGANTNTYYKHSVLTYSHIELGAYMLLQIFLTIRLFLLWRLSVFPPDNSISSFEMNSFFLQEGLWKWFYILVFLFFLAVFYIKNCAIYYREETWFKYLNILTLLDWLNNHFGLFEWHHNTEEIFDSELDPFKRAELQRVEAERVSAQTAEKEKNNTRWNDFTELLKSRIPDIRFLIIFFVIIVVLGIISIAMRSTRLCILIPVTAYFVGDMILTARYSPTYQDDMVEENDELIRRRHLLPFLLTSIHMLFWSGVLYIADSGFGILFLSFGLIWTMLKLREVDLYASSRGYWEIMLLMLAFVGIIVYYKDLLLLSVSNSSRFIAICAILGFGLTYLIGRALIGNHNKVMRLSIAAISAGVVALAGAILAYEVIPGTHTEQRVRVHMSSPAEQLTNIPDQQTERRFLTASLNDWILDQYYKEGEKVKLFGARGKGYFQILPHSKIGALWGAQVSDISLSRFVIAEHGQWLPVYLILAFLILLSLGIARSAHSRVAKGLLIQIPLLLFVQSLVIWMAVTRRFIFLGQDFPLISCNSKLTIIYTLTLLFLWIAAIVYESIFIHERTIEQDDAILTANRSNMKTFLIFMSAIGLLFTLRQATSPYGENAYRLDAALDNVSESFNRAPIAVPDSIIESLKLNETSAVKQTDDSTREILVDGNKVGTEEDNDSSNVMSPVYTLNMLIDAWQEVEQVKYKGKKKANQMMDANHWINDIHDTHQMMTAFDKQFRDFVRDAYNSEDSLNLAYRLYDYYINVLSNHNSYDNILHMRRNKRTGRAVLAVKSNYYYTSLPSRKNTSWTGSIIEHQSQLAEGHILQAPDYEAVRYPGGWFADGQDVVTLHRKRNILTIESRASEVPVVMNESSPLLQTIRVFPSDFVKMGGTRNASLSTLMTSTSYLARNLQVNGQRRFVYPMGDTLIWARNLAMESNAEGRRRLHLEKDTIRLGDVPVTIDLSLTRAIYRSIKDNVHERAVVVADGNGHIRALVDSKEPKYRLDPNDTKRIEALNDSLYMVGGHGSKEERLTFGTLAIQHLLAGPGSTQKPLVYGAVTAGFDLGDGSVFKNWDEFALETLQSPANTKPVSNNFELPLYAGVKTYKKFKSPAGDEGGGISDVEPQFYIYKSSNYYNSLMVYIASHDASLFDAEKRAQFLKTSPTKDGQTLFFSTKPSRQMNEEEYLSTWPMMHRIGSGTVVAFNKQPTKDQDKSLLNKQFASIFSLPCKPDTSIITSLYPSITRRAKFSYVYPESAILDAKARSHSGREFAEKIRQTATGQRSVWNVSPVDMAQMYARLMPGQAKIRLSIDPNSKPDNWHDIYAPNNSHFDRSLSTLYQGMNKVYTHNNGTAHHILSTYGVNKLLLDQNGKQKYWIYGKTGTINQSAKVNNDALLATIITNQDITSKNIDKDNFRYFVIFTVLYKQALPRPIQAAVIKDVLNSKIFKDYMEGKDSPDTNKESKSVPETRIQDPGQ